MLRIIQFLSEKKRNKKIYTRPNGIIYIYYVAHTESESY